MAKYEIMLIVSGSLEEVEAKKVAKEILVSLQKTKIENTDYSKKKLAYEINKEDFGYYFQYNFETDEVPFINEFRRLAGLNKKVLRHLIINLEKDYGYRATINEKKVAKSEFKSKVYEVKKVEFEKNRELRAAEYAQKKERKYDEYKNSSSSFEKPVASVDSKIEVENETKITKTKSTKVKEK